MVCTHAGLREVVSGPLLQARPEPPLLPRHFLVSRFLLLFSG